MEVAVKKVDRDDQAVNLARSIASDILIYHRDAVLDGLRNDDLYERLSSQLAEGRQLYSDRVSSEMKMQRNHFERAVVDVLIRKATLQLNRL